MERSREGYRSSSSNPGGPRRVITLERPRNEHLRPVNITVQRMYFGDWSLDNMPPEDSRSEARAGRERGYTRQERGERTGGSASTGRGYTRGGSDRGAVASLNGRQSEAISSPRRSESRPTEAPRTPDSSPVTASTSSTSADDAKRRRRRRGRRTGPAGAEGSAE